MKRESRLTAVSGFHFFRLVYRSVLLILLLIRYVIYRIYDGSAVLDFLERRPLIISVIFVIFTLEMIFRFFPSRIESPGCQKQFASNYIKSGETQIAIPDNNSTVLVLLVWIGFNGIFGALYLAGIFDDGIMLLISCAYSVCDMICILFFCPFQTFIMHDKCCVNCRIYDWGHFMMFTPMLFIKNFYSWSLFFMSCIVLLHWEIIYAKHPERFWEGSNQVLKCSSCKDKTRQLKNVLKNALH